MRCYLIAEGPTDLSFIRAALSELGVEPVEPARAFDGPRLGRGWLPDVDFLCALFPADQGLEAPPSVYLEIGEAVGAGLPVLLIVEPQRRLDPALSPLRAIRTPAVGTPALVSHLGLFLRSIGRPSTGDAPSRSTDAAELSSIRDELRALRATGLLGGSGEARQVMSRRIEEIALRLFRAAGAEAEDATRTDGNGDIAAWVPGTEHFIPGPLLVELKIVREPRLDRAVLDRLHNYALSRDSMWSILLYYRWDPKLKIRLPSGGAWPTVMVFDIEALAEDMRGRTLAQILNNERNAIVHGVGR
ncbi:hypothetical protein [Actinoplanes sp. NPDC051411]|uniref:hypothetical protein n=1 Tax=Actinoplanes sp. NPDC051411 TaxID=3155522 RepID=UPI0034215A01